MSAAVVVAQKVEATLSKGQGYDNLLAVMPNPSPQRLQRYVRIAVQEIRTNPKLAECDPATICQSIAKIVGWGLEIGGEAAEAYLIPRWNKHTNRMECQAQRGVKGLCKQVRNSGEVSMVYAEPVYEGDRFYRSLGSDPRLEHEPADQTTNVTHVYAVCQYKDGSKQFKVMTRKQVEEHRDKFSQQKDGYTWRDNFEEMALKTVLRKLIKQLPITIGSDEDDSDTLPITVEPLQPNVHRYQQIAAAPNIVPPTDRDMYIRQIDALLNECVAKKIDTKVVPEDWQMMETDQLVALVSLLKTALAE